MVLLSMLKHKCNILIVNIIYMVIGLLLYEDDMMMHMVHAYLLLYLQVVHFTVLF